MIDTTIAAIATPLGTGGIGIIRISGPRSLTILKRLFSGTKSIKTSDSSDRETAFLPSHKIHYGFIVDPVSMDLVDEVLAIYMAGPKSYTREDVVEIHSHSGYVVLEKILEMVLDNGALLAEPGEFTKRAFMNGRIDLTQAEGIIDLINAPCETAAQMASEQVTGGFRNIVQGLVEQVNTLLARCEAQIEFSEEIEESVNGHGINDEINGQLIPHINDLILRQKEAAIYKEGFSLTIAGVPNVGKSSLLNQLVQKETAIVSEFPGTTRDVVRDYISINGVPVMICDTAGIQETIDPVECMGIVKAKEQIRAADLVLMVFDGSRDLSEYEIKETDMTMKQKRIYVINKADIGEEETMDRIQKHLHPIRALRVSAKYGTNIDKLKERIFFAMVKPDSMNRDNRVSPNLRQRKILENVIREFRKENLEEFHENSLEFISDTLMRVRKLLGEITGDQQQDGLYDQIFNQFCIGK